MKNFTPAQLGAHANNIDLVVDSIVHGICARAAIQEYAEKYSQACADSRIEWRILVPLEMAKHAGIPLGGNRNNFVQSQNGVWFRLEDDEHDELILCADAFQRPERYQHAKAHA